MIPSKFGKFVIAAALVAAAATPVVVFPAGIAIAQEAAKASTTVDVGAIVGDAEPAILSVLSLVVGAIVALIGWEVKRLLGVTVNAKTTELLHGALMRAAQAGVDAAVVKSRGLQLNVRSEAAKWAIDYMKNHRADLLKKLKLGDGDIEDLLRSHINKLLPPDAQIAA